jgi:hypothetical protein
MTKPSPTPPAKTTRLYIAVSKADQKPVALIEAANASQARHHWANRTVIVRFASQVEIIAATKAGIESEVAGSADDAADSAE